VRRPKRRRRAPQRVSTRRVEDDETGLWVDHVPATERNRDGPRGPGVTTGSYPLPR
jgi:hypothetical protein